jgi:guanylate kinase
MAAGGEKAKTNVARRGLMFVLSSPSGAGKSTLAGLLKDRVPGLRMSVSVTTRPKRPGEVDGEHYHFIDQARFDEMVRQNELLEFATVFGNSYGTPRDLVEDALAAGEDVLFDIDWQGTQQLREKAPADLVTVFILPPSVRDLEHRLHTRAQDSDEVIHHRMKKAGDEMSRWGEYDYIVINENVDVAFEGLRSILRAERLKRERQTGLSAFVRELQKQLGG